MNYNEKIEELNKRGKRQEYPISNPAIKKYLAGMRAEAIEEVKEFKKAIEELKTSPLSLSMRFIVKERLSEKIDYLIKKWNISEIEVSKNDY